VTSPSYPCLLLSYDYQPLRYVDVKHAFRLIFANKADIIKEYKDRVIRTVSKIINAPAVIRLLGKFKLRFPIKLSRRNIFIRDKFMCQYCGKEGKPSDLTLDHITPRSRGGKFTWENIVTSCYACNTKKGDREPNEAGMGLLCGEPKRLETLEYLRKCLSYSRIVPECEDFLR